jgi:hypothetical protein
MARQAAAPAPQHMAEPGVIAGAFLGIVKVLWDRAGDPAPQRTTGSRRLDAPQALACGLRDRLGLPHRRRHDHPGLCGAPGRAVPRHAASAGHGRRVSSITTRSASSCPASRPPGSSTSRGCERASKRPTMSCSVVARKASRRSAAIGQSWACCRIGPIRRRPAVCGEAVATHAAPHALQEPALCGHPPKRAAWPQAPNWRSAVGARKRPAGAPDRSPRCGPVPPGS